MSDNSAFINQRKTSNRSFIDVFVVLFCLTGAAVSLYLFYLDLYVSFRSSSETQVGVVVVRQNLVHRRLNDRLVWDRLFTDTPVYNGDVINVARLSGAELNVDDSQIELGENTLIRIQKDDDLLKINFYSGKINITSNSNSTPLFLSFGDSVVEASAGSVLSASSGDNGTVLRITEGKAYIIQEGNVSQVLTAAPDKEVIILQNKANGRLEAVSAQEAQKRQEEIQTLRQELQQTLLEEKIAMQVSMNEALRETLPQGLAQPQEKTEEAPPIALAPVSEIEAEALPAFVVYEEPPTPRLVAPAVTTPTPTPRTAPAQRTAPAPRTAPAAAQRAAPTQRTAPAPVVTPASIPAPAPVVTTPTIIPVPETVTQTSNTRAEPIIETTPPAITPVPETVTQTSNTQAEPIRETAAEEQAPAQSMKPLFPAPLNMLPANGYRLGADQMRQSKSIIFSWSKVEGANSYILTIFKEGTLRPERIFQTEISDNTQKYTFDNFRLLDNNGAYIWQLEAISYNSDDIIDRRGRPGESKFIMDVPRPGRVRVREMGILYGTE